MEIIKKNGLTQPYDFSKIKNAVTKSASRVNVKFSQEDWNKLESYILDLLKGFDQVPVEQMHNTVELALDKLNENESYSFTYTVPSAESAGISVSGVYDASEIVDILSYVFISL